jgi:hypothetical protein
MRGEEVFNEIDKVLAKVNGAVTAPNRRIADYLNIAQARLSQLKGRNLTARQVAGLLAGACSVARKQAEAEAIRPIIEFLQLNRTDSPRGARHEMFSIGSGTRVSAYLKGIRDELKQRRGIYIFHDSRGRALYAGKAIKLGLWTEMTNAYNRDREVQTVWRVAHPKRHTTFGDTDGQRRIVRVQVKLHDIAAYVSAYHVADGLIDRFEALVIRSFANDLLNMRMESLGDK